MSPIPLFDILIECNHYDVEFETEFDKCESNAIEDYDYEIFDIPEEMNSSEFANAIKLARLALQEYFRLDNTATDYDSAQKFIKEYIGEDIDGMSCRALLMKSKTKQMSKGGKSFSFYTRKALT